MKKTGVQGGFVISHKVLVSEQRSGTRNSAFCHVEVGCFFPHSTHCIQFVFPPRNCEIQLMTLKTDLTDILQSEAEKQQVAEKKSSRSIFCCY